MKNVIWDFDGTLFNTYPEMIKAFSQTLAYFNIEDFEIDTEDIYATMRRGSVGTAVKKFSAIYGLQETQVRDKFNHIEPELVQNARPFEGIADLLKETKLANRHHFLETHRNQLAVELLNEFELTQYFDVMVTKDDGVKRKPNPEGINLICEKFELNRGETVMISDRKLDIEAGNNAGINSWLFDYDHLIIVDGQPNKRFTQVDDIKKSLLED